MLKTLAVLGGLSLATRAFAAIPAFPGAEGYGAYATGGRGGDVYHVTNLNSSGEGSLAYGIENAPSNGRTIVFDVSGYIHVPGSNLRITKNKITLAGQTAPGDGIGLKDGTFRISADDIIVQHMRFRHGKYGSGGDCIDLDSASINTILDHISMQFSTDENISSFNSPPENLTLQWSLNAWGLESHSCGGLWDQNHATCHHSLWAHNHTRNPKARPSGLLEWVNNVTFDWDIGFIMGDSETPATWKANVIGNYFICPPGNTRSVALEKANIDRNGGYNFSLYVNNNLLDKNGNTVLDGSDYGFGIASGSYVKSTSPFDNTGSSGVVADDPRISYKKIVSNAGALRMDAGAGLTLRDEVDTILLNNLTSLKRGHVTRESDTGASNSGFGSLNSTSAPIDSDRDGMPDLWENALGWSATADDHNIALAGSGGVIAGVTFFPASTPVGYTRLEEYLFFLSHPHITVAKNTVDAPTSLDVDLSYYTAGFKSSPTFVLSNVIGGQATQSGSGGRMVHFVPTQNSAGRARFEFTVTDSDGDIWTQSFLILVAASGVPKDLVWTGNPGNNIWDTSTARWDFKGDPAVFTAGDFVLFDDRGTASPSVALTASVAPGSVTVDSSQIYTFSGPGAIVCVGDLVKRGSGRLQVYNTGSNLFSSVTVEEGTLAANQPTSLGSGPVHLNGGELTLSLATNATFPNSIVVDNDSTVNVLTQHYFNGSISGSGVLNLNATGMWSLGSAGMGGFHGTLNMGASTSSFRFNGSTGSTSTVFDLGTASATLFNRNGVTIDLGALKGGPNTSLSGAGSVDSASTYNIGALGLDTTFSGKIVDGSSSARKTNITKVGSGTLILDGTLSHTGTTTASAGELIIASPLPFSPVSITSGGTLISDQTFGAGISVASGGKLDPGSAAGEIGILTANAGLSVAAGTLHFDLSSTPTGPKDQITVASGTLSLSGAVVFDINPVEAELTPGTYPLINGNGTLSASGLTMTPNVSAPAGTTRQTFSLLRPASGTTPGYVNLIVSGAPADLIWSGSGSTTWDLQTTSSNWTNASPSVFYNLDKVTFDDSASIRSVALSGTLQPVSINVNNDTGSYLFSGSGVLAGRSRLIKDGTASLTIANTSANTYTGGTVLKNGILAISNTSSPLGTGLVEIEGGRLHLISVSLANDIVFRGDCAITSSGNISIASATTSHMYAEGNPTINLVGMGGILTFGGDMSDFSGTLSLGTGNGMLRINGNTNACTGSSKAAFDLGTGSGRLVNRNGDTTIYFGSVSGGASTALEGRQTGTDDSSSTYRIGGLNTDATFAGAIKNSGDLGGLHIIKEGTGTWTLSGQSDFVGSVSIEQGKIVLPGSMGCSGAVTLDSGTAFDLSGGHLTSDSFVIASGANVSGAGTIDSEVRNQGTLLCDGPGTLTINGDVYNDGVMRLRAGAILMTSGSIVNNGVLDLVTAGGSLPENLVNNGTVIDSSAVIIRDFHKEANVCHMSITSASGHDYALQFTSSLSENWTTLETKAGVDGQTLTFDHDNPNPGARGFYRIVITP